MARIARMHGKWPHPVSIIKLRENPDYIKAIKEIGGIGIGNLELPL
jgi:beta-N-acetylhexosaminidase